MPLPSHDPRLDVFQAQVDALLEQVYLELIENLRTGMDPALAFSLAQETAYEGIQSIYLVTAPIILSGAFRPPVLEAYRLGGLTLSQRLYRRIDETTWAAKAVLEAHMKGLHKAESLVLDLFEGYDFKLREVLQVKAKLPKYLAKPFALKQASKLKTPALRAAYVQMLKTEFDTASWGEVAKKMRVAWYERNRYFAGRIARTELARTVNTADAIAIMGEGNLEVVEIRLSPAHPKMDICDLHARANLWGLGPGLYPKGATPLPPFHPFCFCIPVKRYDLSAKKAGRIDGAERSYVRKLTKAERAAVMGSKKRANEFLSGRGFESLINDGKHKDFHLKHFEDLI